MSPSIFENVLDGRHAQYEQDRYHGYFLPESIDLRKPVEQNDKNEMEVGYPMELKKTKQKTKCQIMSGHWLNLFLTTFVIMFV